MAEVLNSSIAPKISEVFYEVHEDWVDPVEIQGLLESFGFKYFRKVGGGKRYDILAARVSGY